MSSAALSLQDMINGQAITLPLYICQIGYSNECKNFALGFPLLWFKMFICFLLVYVVMDGVGDFLALAQPPVPHALYGRKISCSLISPFSLMKLSGRTNQNMRVINQPSAIWNLLQILLNCLWHLFPCLSWKSSTWLCACWPYFELSQGWHPHGDIFTNFGSSA